MPGNSRNQAYIDHVRRLEQRVECKDEAMRLAVGGEFDAVGKLEYYLLRSLGLRSGHLVIDVGCGSGRLARQLASDTSIRYVGTDVVPRLLEAARTAAGRNDWEFRLLKVSGSRVRTMWPISSRSSLFSPTSPTRRVFNISRRIKWENRTVMKSLGNLGQSVAVLRKV
jgi:SAM-dependent methyltransferase